MTENENQDEYKDNADVEADISGEYEEGEEGEHGIENEEYIDEEELLDDGEKELTEEELEALFNKNTESFRCLQQVLMSRSSLLRNPLYFFPPLEDPGIDEAFDYVEQEEVTDDVCAEKYKKLCKDMNIVPLSRVIKSLPTKSLNLSYYGLTEKQVKAIAKALELNCHVEDLNIEENFLTPDSVSCLGEAISENNTLKRINMKECRIGSEGAEMFNEGLMTQSLVELDLSFNSLGTNGIKALLTGLKENGSIKILNLSHNELDETTAPLLASVLKENVTLENLDLSWNGFSTPAAMKILCEGLLQNSYLKALSLAWNGISSKLSIKPLIKFLKETEVLEFLDLSNNRIGGVTFRMIRNVILKNHSLLGLNLGFNVITPDEALDIVSLFTLPINKRPKLNALNLDNVFVKKEFVPLWKRAMRLGNTITIAGILGNWSIHGPDTNKLLFERARFLCMKPKKKKAKKDFGHFIFSLPEKPVSKPDFETLVKKFKMKKVDRDLLVEIMKSFRYKKSGVDCVKMRDMYTTYYPDAEPAPKKKKGKKGKKGKKAAESQTSEPTTEAVSESPIIDASIEKTTTEKGTDAEQTSTKEVTDAEHTATKEVIDGEQEVVEEPQPPVRTEDTDKIIDNENLETEEQKENEMQDVEQESTVQEQQKDIEINEDIEQRVQNDEEIKENIEEARSNIQVNENVSNHELPPSSENTEEVTE